jgi:serine/threonine-protein kinase
MSERTPELSPPDTPGSETLAGNQDPPSPHSTADTPAAPPGSASVAAIPGVVGRFRIGEELAHGGMGVVYRAHEPSIGRDVAVTRLIERRRQESSSAVRA